MERPGGCGEITETFGINPYTLLYRYVHRKRIMNKDVLYKQETTQYPLINSMEENPKKTGTCVC